MSKYLRDLSTFNKEEIKEFLGTFDTILTDGDGVLWYLLDPFPGAIEAFNRLKALGKKIFLVSNNSTTSVDDYLAKAKEIKLNLEEDEVIIPSLVALQHLQDQNFNKKAYMLTSPAFIKDFESNGIKCSNDVGPDHAVHGVPAFREQMKGVDRDVGAVILDFDLNINYIKMMKALVHLRKRDCHFIVGAPDYKIPVENNFNIIGPGGFLSILETISGRKALVAGKPSTMIKDFIVKRHPTLNPERTLMIGDMMDTDMRLGTNCGFQKLFVLSGLHSLEDAKQDPSNLPHYYISSLTDLLPLLPTS